jgi:hypothetical protein
LRESPPRSEPPSEEEVESRMRPGAYSKTGFLGPSEKLRDVIVADAQTLRELNLSYEEVASKLDSLLVAAENAPTHQARVGELRCRIQMYQGFQICPWAIDPHHAQCAAGLGVRHGSVDWWITNMRTGEEMKGPGLVVHLIRDHHFFEGMSSPNRVDPHRLARLLGLR